MEIKINQVFEYQNKNYTKYFIPKKFIDNLWWGIQLDSEFNILDCNNWSENYLNEEWI